MTLTPDQPAHPTSTTLRPALREAANALRIGTTLTGHDQARTVTSAGPTRHGESFPEPAEIDAGVDAGVDDEAAAIAELGQLIDAVSDTVNALGRLSRSSRRGKLRALEARLADVGQQATSLSRWPETGTAP